MPLTLLEYQVFRQTAQLFSQIEIDAPAVPTGQTWRVGHLAVAIFYPPAEVVGTAPPVVGVYDVAQPGATVVPCSVTQLSPLAVGGSIAGVNVPGGSSSSGVLNSWFDVDDDAGITLLSGNQLEVIFYQPELGGPSPIGAVRAELAIFEGVPGQPTAVAGATAPPAIPADI